MLQIYEKLISEPDPCWHFIEMVDTLLRMTVPKLTLESIKTQLSGLKDTGTFTNGLSRAAVLMCICPPDGNSDESPLLLLTKRTHSVETHKGQISFPGGVCESHDSTPIASALRETEEEIGISREYVSVIGCLPSLDTPSGFSILPVVGIIRQGFRLLINPDEVAEVFFVPLSYFMNGANTSQRSIVHEGIERKVYVFHWQGMEIWGATAWMIEQLCRYLGKSEGYVD